MIEKIREALQQYINVAWSEEDIIELRPLPNGTGLREWIGAAELLEPERIERLVSENKAGANIFAGILPRERKGDGSAKDIKGGRVVWVDYDHISPEEAIMKADSKGCPPPSMVVNTGHGAHLFWKLERYTPAADINIFLKRFATFVGADTAATDLSRILRLPGFQNTKDTSEEVYASIVYAEPGCVYALSELSEILPEDSYIVVEQPVSTPRKPIGWQSNTDNTEVIRARKYIEEIEGCSTGGRNKATYRVAAVLINDYQLSGKEALDLLSEWDLNRNNPPIQTDPKYKGRELERLLESAQKYSRKAAGNKLRPAVDVDAIQLPTVFSNTLKTEPEIKSESKKQGRPKSYEVAFRKFMNPGGTLQLMCDYINNTSYKLQPELALMSSIVAMGTVVGRLIQDEDGTLTNVYAVGVAGSGKGKDRALEVIEEIFSIAGIDDFIVPPSFVSGSALINAIAEQPNCISLTDEIGEYFKVLKTSGKRNPHMQEVIKDLLRLYSSNKKAYRSSGAVSRSSKIVYSPCYNFYGCTVAESLYEGLSIEAITSGFLPRIFLMEGRKSPKKNEVNGIITPENIAASIEHWNWLRNEMVRGGNVKDIQQKIGKPDMEVYPYESGVRDYYSYKADIYSEKGDEVGYPWDALWTRVLEKGKKLALIHACSLQYGKVTLESAQYGVEFSETNSVMSEFRLNDNLYENEDQQFEKLILSKIEENGGVIGQRDLGQKTKHKINVIQRNKIIKALIDGGVIEAGKDGKKITYSLIED